ncbi:DUF4031 domain-containing protein [Georgenia subflava]|uniref:DUF4031 domain-containing protein n=1 Tax=Georgenia subflava TaxID=1622177 RepID=A0A6N7ENH9_9MICO|nr:DUF4031 domain-containing protein [Georgenia subflava]MPV38095.1 DUF4031 domain-containing protein [Georgenia subflava]
MAILVDPPRWPAHGTVWAHLVSDTSLVELHAFARSNGVPRRAFDLDHYDVPAERIDDLVEAGAERVEGRVLLSRLRGSGLRVRGADRADETARRRRAELAGRWAALVDEPPPGWAELGEELIARWSEPHRRYHDLVHLHDVLRHLDDLGDDGEEVTRSVRLAAWFHDAVYDGVPGVDEEASAMLAEDRLRTVGVPAAEVTEVSRLVRLTAGHSPGPDDPAGAALCDADLAILAAAPARYRIYGSAVRAEYAHVPDADFRRGRAAVLADLLGHDRLFTTAAGFRRWEQRARENIAAELGALQS